MQIHIEHQEVVQGLVLGIYLAWWLLLLVGVFALGLLKRLRDWVRLDMIDERVWYETMVNQTFVIERRLMFSDRQGRYIGRMKLVGPSAPIWYMIMSSSDLPQFKVGDLVRIRDYEGGNDEGEPVYLFEWQPRAGAGRRYDLFVIEKVLTPAAEALGEEVV